MFMKGAVLATKLEFSKQGHRAGTGCERRGLERSLQEAGLKGPSRPSWERAFILGTTIPVACGASVEICRKAKN